MDQWTFVSRVATLLTLGSFAVAVIVAAVRVVEFFNRFEQTLVKFESRFDEALAVAPKHIVAIERFISAIEGGKP